MARPSGGRAARLEARTGAGATPVAPAFIRRRIPNYELVGEEGLALGTLPPTVDVGTIVERAQPKIP